MIISNCMIFCMILVQIKKLEEENSELKLRLKTVIHTCQYPGADTGVCISVARIFPCFFLHSWKKLQIQDQFQCARPTRIKKRPIQNTFLCVRPSQNLLKYICINLFGFDVDQEIFISWETKIYYQIVDKCLNSLSKVIFYVIRLRNRRRMFWRKNRISGYFDK